MVLLLTLLACNDFSIVKQDGGETGGPDDHETAAPIDTSTSDTAPDSGGDTSAETGTNETADTSVDTSTDTSTDTSVDTAVDTGEDTGPAPPLVVAGMCTSGYPYTSWSDPSATEPELNVVGVYESQAGSGGPVTVHVPRTASMVLALTSYSSVDWQIDLDAGANVTEILISSYEATTWTFTGAGTAPVSYVGWIGECGYEIPDMDPHSGCETPDLQTVLEATTGLAMSSFQGCYSGGEYAVDE